MICPTFIFSTGFGFVVFLDVVEKEKDGLTAPLKRVVLWFKKSKEMEMAPADSPKTVTCVFLKGLVTI